MALEFGWEDTEEVGIQLQEKFPEQDPLAVRFTRPLEACHGAGGVHGRPREVKRIETGSDSNGMVRGI